MKLLPKKLGKKKILTRIVYKKIMVARNRLKTNIWVPMTAKIVSY